MRHAEMRAPADITRVMQAKPESAVSCARDRILAAADSLGVLGGSDGTPARMLSLLCNPNVEAREVSALIKRQPALCGRVLRVANSPYYGQPRGVKTIERAFFVLGMDAVRGIAAAACLERTVSVCNGGGLLNMNRLLGHSVATAVAAESLAKILRFGLAPDAFIAGLLHHLGMAVQVAVDPAGVARLLQERAQGSVLGIHDLEAAHCSVSHEQCVMEIFGAWQLPDSLIAAAGHHHDPRGAPARFQELAALVNLGARLAAHTGHDVELELPERDPAPAPVIIELPAEEIAALIAALPERVQCLRAALGE
jgi:HD-like signal output (HDOD) protein